MDRKLNVVSRTVELLRSSWKCRGIPKFSSCLFHCGGDPKLVTDRSIRDLSNEAPMIEPIDLEKDEQRGARDPQPEIEREPNAKPNWNAGTRVNELNIQMLSRTLYEQIFEYGKSTEGKEPRNRDEMEGKQEKLVLKAKNQLKKLGLWTDQVNYLPDINMKLPKLEGNNIEEHFWHIGKEQSDPYRKLLEKFIKTGVPDVPKNWLRRKGWTKYKAGEDPKMVPFPDEEALVLDVEVTLKAGEGPTLAVAVSSDAWYGWVSSTLVEEVDPICPNHYSTDMFIPLEREKDNRCRIVVGHNVSYDRARIKEQYYLGSSRLRFMDTMSLHNCIGGICRAQKSLMKTKTEEADQLIWHSTSKTCLTSLKDVYSLYCNAELSKEDKNIFVEGSLQDVRQNFELLMNYCSRDVKATFEVLQVLFPMFTDRFPHPVTLAGMLELGMAYMTVNSNWEKYLKESEEKYQEIENEMKFLLAKKCDMACEMMHDERYKGDLWMWDEDWSTAEFKFTKKRKEKKSSDEKTERVAATDEYEDEELQRLMAKFKYLFDMEQHFPAVMPLLPGYPNWYRKLCNKPNSQDWKPGPQALTASMVITPKLLKLTYEGYPLHHVRDHGWGFLVADLGSDNKNTAIPIDKLKEVTVTNQNSASSSDNSDSQFSQLLSTSNSNRKQLHKSGYSGTGIWCGKKIDDCCFFLKLPHKDGNDRNVGNPLSKSFNSVVSSIKLSGPDSVSEKALSMRSCLSYWRNNRDRIMGQMVVWLNEKERKETGEGGAVGVIIPRIVVCGTLTRRAVESTWLTASKSAEDRLGSELRSMIQAPPGYHFVGADVDSQELWIASLIGDSTSSKIHGGTPLGWMNLSGTKLRGTDLHSITAKAAGISRDHAKVINYSRIYGAGVQFAQRLLQQYNPTMTLGEAKNKAQKMYSMTKGKNVFRIRKDFADRFKIDNAEDIKFTDLNSAICYAKKYRMALEDVFHDREWEGGMESAMFNQLEKIACSPVPRTPFLGCRLSRALEPRYRGDDQYMSTRINWVVQSGGVDFLHLMLVCMRWLTEGRARFSLSFHDEVRYLVPSEDRYKAALALQITNLLTRSFFASRMGLKDLPLSVAFFSSVEVDKVMRKEADDDCVTPSNPHGLKIGYDIPHGECLDIYNTLEKSGGDLSSFRQGS